MKPAQLLDRDGEHLALLASHGGDSDRPPDHLSQIADEAVPTVQRQQAGVRRGTVEDGDRAGQHHHEVGVPVADPEEHVVRPDRADAADPLQRADLLGRQPRVRAVQVRRLVRLDLPVTGHARQVARVPGG